LVLGSWDSWTWTKLIKKIYNKLESPWIILPFANIKGSG
jgi:hypothetical protein